MSEREAWTRGVGLAVIAKRLLRDVGDAGDFAFRGGEEFDLAGIGGLLAGEEDEVHDGFERVVDLVGDGGGHSAGGGDLFCLKQRLLESFSGGDVAEDLCSADDLTRIVADWGDAERDVEPPAIFGDANGFEVLDALAGTDFCEDNRLVCVQLRGNDLEDGDADHLFAAVSEDAGGGGIPAGDVAVEVFAEDGVVGGFDDGGELTQTLGGSFIP